MAEGVPTPRQIAEHLGDPEGWRGEPEKWNEAMAEYPKGAVSFLSVSGLEEKCKAAGIAPDRAPMLAAVAEEAARDPLLRAFAWYMHWRVFVSPAGGDWPAPSLEKRFGARAGIFFLLLSLDFPDRLRCWHRTLSYPPEVTQETVKQIACYEVQHLSGRGVPGIYEGMFMWMSAYFAGPFVRLGRFEYQLHKWGEWDAGLRIFRRASDGAVVALAGEGIRVRDDGLVFAQDAPESSGWKTKYGETPEGFKGFLIDPEGRIVRREVLLPRKEWKSALAVGDAILYLHIPYGGGMTWEAVRDSLRRALEFFPRYHPDRPVRLLLCNTWFMDPRLPEVLGEDSNPARFQRACYLYPCEPDPTGLRFVLGWGFERLPPDEIPVKTSMQRKLVVFLKQGGVWNGGGLFMLPEEMADPSEGAYRAKFASLSF